MNETQRLEKLKTTLRQTVIKTCDAEVCLEEAADLAVIGSAKETEIWELKKLLDRLGTEILELSKT